MSVAGAGLRLSAHAGHDEWKRMTRAFDVIIERDCEGCYVASVPEVLGCHTQPKSLDALMKRIREAIEICLEVESERISHQEFIGVQRIWVEA